MKNTIVALSLFASTVTAQQVTAAPKALFKQASLLNFGAADADDDGAQICQDVGSLILDCGEQWGGPDEIANLPPDEILGCACCDSGRPIYSDYASCSAYLTASVSALTSEAGVYGDLATMCSQMGGSCSGRASATGESSTSRSSRPTSVSASASASAASATITPGVAVTECNKMLDMFGSCISETPRFTELGFRSQAECYCCGSSRGQTTGTLTWTNEIDEYASVCWDWAEDSATDTMWDYASTFATFCENFSDVCNGMSITVESSDETETDAPRTAQVTDPVTVTVTNNNAQNTETEEPDAATGLRAGAAGGVVALVAGLLML